MYKDKHYEVYIGYYDNEHYDLQPADFEFDTLAEANATAKRFYFTGVYRVREYVDKRGYHSEKTALHFYKNGVRL